MMYCCDVVVGEVDLDGSAETASVRHLFFCEEMGTRDDGRR
jgi:hypothetical protein